MTIKFRPYNRTEDFDKVSDLLFDTYVHNQYPNWLQPRWEYMHFHPILDEENLHKIGIWEDDGKVVAVVNYELSLGDVFLSIAPGYEHLKQEMFEYAEENFKGISGLYPDKKYLTVNIKEFDKELEEIAIAKGYEKDMRYPQYATVSQFTIPCPFPEIKLPEGYKLKSLADENDLYKINRVLWRGFDHEGEPPETEEDIAGRIKMQSGPHFRKDLTIVVEAPDGNYVAFCGMWFDAINKISYVEPVATDPDYRKMGLGKAAVLEGIRRCGELGATVAFVESAIPFYLNIGFEKIFNYNPWNKYFEKEA